MDADQDRLELHFEDDEAEVLANFVNFVANKRLLSYKKMIHTGGKSGESLWSHVMNLVMVVEKLRPIFELEEREMQCLLLALVVHDLNKLDEYGRLPNGKGIRYAQVTPPENLESALEGLDVGEFFGEWRKYRLDIKYLADAHQEKVALVSQHDPKLLEQCQLRYDRLQGPLRYLMKVADVADNSHTGEYASRHEGHIRDKLIKRLNEALQQGSIPHRYCMVGYRLAEFRGLQTNIMHNVMIAFLRAMYGEDACIDLLYHADGTDFLLERSISFTWTPQMQKELAKKIGQKFADLQAGQLAQFIKAKPSGIAVDQAAIESGASLERIFQTITGVVERKKYSQEWREQRQQAIRGDLEDFLRQEQQQEQTPLAQRVRALLAEGRLLPTNDEQLKRGEFVIAYRNFLKDHRDQACRAIKQDAWQRVAHLFQVSAEDYAVSRLIDPYRRGYIMACSLPPTSLEEMMEAALDDLAQLDQQAKIKSASTRKKSATPESDAAEEDEQGEMELDVAAIEDYLARHLQVWDDAGMLAMSPVAFHETLSRYVRDTHPERQCCYCGSALKADEWMAVQVPPSIGVQSFSNRLDGGSSREPKRNVCAICRTQFILEKLAWQAHRDKQGKDEVTFYLHLFSYSFLTKPLLDAWWLSIKRLGGGEHKALFLKTHDYFKEWEKGYQGFQHPVSVTNAGIHGLGMPTFPEAISNTPILPLHIPGDNAGSQFLLALEKTLILANWFDCRVILSRLPTPLLNLEQEHLKEHEEKEAVPVALLVENVPSAMNWLLPRNVLTRAEVEILCKQLSLLHQITEQIASPDEHVETVIYRLISAAARDPLALYYEIDRQIERIVARQKGGSPEQRALSLSARVAPLIETLLHLQEEGVSA